MGTNGYMEQDYLYELIRKYADNVATPEEMQELQDWYRGIHTVETVEWETEHPDEKERLRQRMLQRLESRMKPRLRQIPWVRIAACLILVAGAWIVWQNLRPRTPNPEFVSVYNPSGKIQEVRLPDGSRAWLNAMSSLRYARAFDQQRDVYLEGEAYFDVTTDNAHPFIAHAGTLAITVLGTGFDIKSFATERYNTVTVIRGKVQVDHAGTTLGQLTAARQLQWDDRGRKAQTVSVDTNQVLGWQQGKLQFQGQTMEEIAGGFGRWYDMRFEFKDSSLRKCRYYVNFSNTLPLRDVLTTMSEMNGMSFTIDEKKHIVTLSGKGCL